MHENAEFQLVPEIKKLWTQDAPIFLDEEGIAKLGKWVAKHPGALLICDSLSDSDWSARLEGERCGFC